MTGMRRAGMLAILGVASVFLAAACGGGSGSSDSSGGGGDSVKIVSDLPLQGANRAQTTTMVNSIKLALQERNNKAGKVKVNYESLDDATAQSGQWDEAKCAENAQDAASNDSIVGWIGPFNSGCGAVEIPILNKAGLAMVSPANTYIGLTKPGGESDEPDKYYPSGERNYTRVIVADDKQGAAGAALMQEEDLKSVYILDDKETYGKGLADQFEKATKKAGIEVVGREGIDGSASNYRSLMNKIKQANPDAIYFGGIIENNAAQILKDKVGAGMSNKDVAFIGPDGIFVDELIKQAGDASDGIFVTFGGLPQSKLSDKGKKFVKDYEKKYDDTIQPYTAYAYESANVMLDAIERASKEADGVPKRDAVLKELYATKNYDGVLGTWSFDEDGDTSLTELSIQKIEGGKFKLDRVLDVKDLV